jgi:hypothetical protein
MNRNPPSLQEPKRTGPGQPGRCGGSLQPPSHDDGAVQSSINKPGTRENSRKLFVTAVPPAARAVAEIQRSASLIGVPRASRFARIATYSSSILASGHTTSKGPRNERTRALLCNGFALFAAAYQELSVNLERHFHLGGGRCVQPAHRCLRPTPQAKYHHVRIEEVCHPRSILVQSLDSPPGASRRSAKGVVAHQ